MDEFDDYGITDQYFETNTIASSGADAKEEKLKQEDLSNTLYY